MSEIFISYKSEEREVARQLAAALESHGRSVWWDRELVTGEDIDRVIERAMKAARCVIVIWSKRAVESGYVIDEARFAQKNKKLFPVQIEAVDLPFRFDNLHTHSLAGWDGSASHVLFEDLARDIEKFCDDENATTRAQTAPQPRTEKPPRFNWSRWKWPLTVTAALLVLAPASWLVAKQYLPRGEALTQEQEIALRLAESKFRDAMKTFPEQDRQAREAAPSAVWRGPSEFFQDCAQCPKMVVVPRGQFRMGSMGGENEERPVHVVAIHGRLAVGVYEVTRDQFAAFLEANPTVSITDICLAEDFEGDLESSEGLHWREPGFEQDGSHPVVCVSWNHAVAYSHWLNSMVEGDPYRLPTESEWEYFARAESSTRYWWGDKMEPGKANCASCKNPFDNTGTVPVGRFDSNIFSIADTAGNVGEWVLDCWNASYENAPVLGEAWLGGDCTYRGVRGGRWSTNRKSIRSAARNRFLQGKQVNSVGFRVVRELP